MVWVLVAFSMLTLDAFSASAQSKALGMKLEIVETDDNDNQFAVYTYQEQGGPVGYYMGVGREFEPSEAFGFELLGIK